MTEPSTRRLPAIPGLLDNGLMSGQREVTTVMLPVRHARPVPFDDVEGALAEIERVCQVWGGGEPLLPIAGGALPAPCWKWTTSKPQASVLA